MPGWVDNHDLWEVAKENIMAQLRSNYIPKDKWSWVTREYKRLGGKTKRK